MSRQFEARKATRESVPILIGLVAPSGGGKTYSALRLSTGIRRVVGGEIYMVDTEAKRSLHYADKFDFQFVEFTAPFGPLDYLDCLEYCVSKGAKTIIVDSMSHEHEGPGGVLEMHDAEVERLVKTGNFNHGSASFPAWSKPKADRRRLLNGMQQLGVNFICCYRAKEKIKLPTKEDKAAGIRDPIQLGWMPIAGDEHVYEMTANAILMPGSRGTPTWTVARPGESMIMKLPDQFEHILAPGGKTAQLSEDIGEAMARWAAGDDPFGKAMVAVRESTDTAELKAMLDRHKKEKKLSPTQYTQLVDAVRARVEELKAPEQPATAERQPGEEG